MTDSETTNSAPKHTDQIRADRACIGCGFNLFGQPVTKEEHYGLAISRCPECGEVAALQSYPTMSHWVNRFRVLLAGTWVLAMLIAFVVQLMIIGTIADSFSGGLGDPLAKKIGEAYYLWAEENGTTTSIAGWSSTTPEAYYHWIEIPNDWADEHLDGIITDFGGLWSNFDWSNMLYVIPAWVVAFFAGVFWSIVLLGSTRKKAAVVPLAASGLIIALGFIDFSSSFFAVPQAFQLAKELYANILTPIAVIIQLPALLFGVLFGRKIARWIIVLTLPQRSRISLSLLWTSDGLELPKTNHDVA